MAMKKGLGRGFDSLIPTELIDESLDPTAAQDIKLSDYREISLSDVVPNPDQPRRNFDEQALEEMAQSIKEHGVIQPIVVNPVDGKYQIVAGERRYRSAGRAGLDKIPAIVRTLDDQNVLEISLIENLQRRDLNILETATAYLKLRDQFNLSLEQIGQRVGGKSISAISNTLRLLRLPENVRKALHEGRMTEGQAKPLVGIDPEVVNEVLPKILREEWSARRVEQFVVDLKKSGSVIKSETIARPRNEEMSKLLSESLTARVNIRSNSKGGGAITIKFEDEDDFKRITHLLSDKD